MWETLKNAWRIKEIRKRIPLAIFIVALATLIIISTMVLKQHSSWDVLAGILLNVVYELLYMPFRRLKAKIRGEKIEAWDAPESLSK